MNDREKKIKQYINKLKKQGKNLKDVTNKSIEQLKNANAFKAFEKQVKRVLERDKIIEANKKYDEKLRKKQENKNEKIFKQFPWVKKVMMFDEKYKNIKDAKTVYDRKMNEERQEIINVIDKYFDKKANRKEYNALQNQIKGEKDIFVLRSFAEKAEYIIEAYGAEDEGEGHYEFSYPENEILDRLSDIFRLEQLNNKREKG